MMLSNKGITKELMHRLICTFVFDNPRRQVFTHQGPFFMPPTYLVGAVHHYTINLALVRIVKNKLFFSVYELIKICFLGNGTVRTNKMKF